MDNPGCDLLKDSRVRAEIERHKWIESEKAGRDIGFDEAAQDWLDHYAKEWLRQHPALSPKGGTSLWSRFLLFFVGSFLCLFLVFSSAESVPYVAHDTVRLFNKFFTAEPAPDYLMYKFVYAMGRPLEAELETVVAKSIHHLRDLTRIRNIALVVMSLNAALLGLIAYSYGMAAVPAFCIGVAVFTLPGFQETFFVPALCMSLAVSCALLAHLIWISRWVFLLRFLLALVLVETGFFIYPLLAFAFLVPVAVRIIVREDDDWRDSLRVWLRDVLFFGIAAGVYFLFSKLFFYKLNLMTSGYKTDFSLGHIFTRSQAFLAEVVPTIFNLWHVDYSKALGIGLAALAAGLWILGAILRKKAGEWQRGLMFLVIFLAVNALWFISHMWIVARLVGLAEAVALLFIFWCGQRLIRIWFKERKAPALLWPAAILLTGMVLANITVVRNVWNMSAELMFVRSRLVSSLNSSTTGIHVVQIKEASPAYNGFNEAYDQFNYAVARTDYEVPDLIRAALLDIYLPQEIHCGITVTQERPLPEELAPGTLLVDMNDLRRIGRWN